MRRLTAALVAAVAVVAPGLLAGCSEDDEPPRVAPTPLPENLCATVPADLIAEWALEETEHRTVEDDDRVRAACTMRGRYLGSELQLGLALTSLGGPDRAQVNATIAREVTSLCDVAEREAADDTTFTEDETECRLRDPGGSVTHVSQALPVHGVAFVSVAYDGENPSAVAAQAEGLMGELTLAVPGETGGS